MARLVFMGSPAFAVPTLEALARYPMHSRIAFVECAGNSGALNAPQPQALNVAGTHGLLACQEWTGVRLADGMMLK